MSLDLHRYYLEVSKNGDLRVEVICPYAKNDRGRPCWARDEAGGLDEFSAEDCNYQEWLDNVGTEMVAGDRRFMIDGARMDWSNGDYPVLRVDLDRAHRNAVDAALAPPTSGDTGDGAT